MKVLWLVFCFLLSYELSYSGTIVFFDPDVNLRHPTRIKKMFQKLLGSDLDFRAFKKEKDFLREIQRNKPDLIIVSFNLVERKLIKNFRIVLKSYRNGRRTYKKYVISSKTPSHKKVVSLVSTISKNSQIMKKVLSRKEFAGKRVSVIKVSKDMDAFLAVGFGRADYCLVSETTYEFAKKRSPFLIGKTRIIGKPVFLPLPVAGVVGKPSKDSYRIISVLKHLHENSDGKKLLKMLNLSRWGD